MKFHYEFSGRHINEFDVIFRKTYIENSKAHVLKLNKNSKPQWHRSETNHKPTWNLGDLNKGEQRRILDFSVNVSRKAKAWTRACTSIVAHAISESDPKAKNTRINWCVWVVDKKP